MYKSFRPGDVVRAEVLSLGDTRNYLLATTKNELGVVFAESVAGIEACACVCVCLIAFHVIYSVTVLDPCLACCISETGLWL